LHSRCVVALPPSTSAFLTSPPPMQALTGVEALVKSSTHLFDDNCLRSGNMCHLSRSSIEVPSSMACVHIARGVQKGLRDPQGAISLSPFQRESEMASSPPPQRGDKSKRPSKLRKAIRQERASVVNPCRLWLYLLDTSLRSFGRRPAVRIFKEGNCVLPFIVNWWSGWRCRRLW